MLLTQRSTLLEIWSYIRKQGGTIAADRVERSILDKIGFIAERPYLGHWRRDLTDEPVRFFAVYSYLIVYRPDARPLQVAAILHGRRDIARRLQESSPRRADASG